VAVTIGESKAGVARFGCCGGARLGVPGAGLDNVAGGAAPLLLGGGGGPAFLGGGGGAGDRDGSVGGNAGTVRPGMGGGAGTKRAGDALAGGGVGTDRPGAGGGVTGAWRAGGGVCPEKLGGVAVVLAGASTEGGLGTPLEGAPWALLVPLLLLEVWSATWQAHEK